MSFAGQLEKFAAETRAKSDLIVTTIVVDVARSLIDRSPVGDPSYWKKKPPAGYTGGQFKSNWNYGFNAPDYSTAETIDKIGTATLAKIEAQVSKEAGKHFITNSLEYANRLEEGWSRQAPNGMVGLTVIDFTAIVGNSIKKHEQ